MRAHLCRQKIISRCEQVITKEQKTQVKFVIQTEGTKSNLDFKEVFKWIVSPLMAKGLGVPANLEGLFWVKCDFAGPEEQEVLESLNKALTFGHQKPQKESRGAKWKNKYQDKDRFQKASQSALGADQIFQKAKGLPLAMLENLAIFQNSTELVLPKLRIECSHDNILLYGRYCKLSREVSQTPWMLEGDKAGIQSVQELIAAPIQKEIFGASQVYLHGSGREDVDVRMIGRGRPFILELVNPKLSLTCHKRSQELTHLINSQNDLVKCRDVRIADKATFDALKNSIESKAKAYCCVVWAQKPISQADCAKLSAMTDIEVAQKTPVRVLHRRSQLVRAKMVYRLKAEWINAHYFTLHVLASAGTYIKEFVHGDLGRTTPSIVEILDSEADILQLDVVNVFDDLSEVTEGNDTWYDTKVNN